MTRNARGEERRRVLRQAVLAGPLVLMTGAAAAVPKAKKGEARDEEVSPTEDLMREHGVLRRILLVYGEASRRLEAGQAIAVEAVTHGAQIVRAFIEDYHERDEEEFVFPRFEQSGQHVALVKVLRDQHQVGRKLTASILRLATPAGVAGATGRLELARALRAFGQMYEAHAAREDTVLFPAFRALISAKELDRLMEIFEDKEKALPLGGFEKMVGEVAKLESAFGLEDLAKATPRI
jgi:hemerythrin-like domain-containing protein